MAREFCMPSIRTQPFALKEGQTLLWLSLPLMMLRMRTIATGIDVRNPTRPVVDTVQVHNARPIDVVQRVQPMFTHSQFSIAPIT